MIGTKIIATLGPATANDDSIAKMIDSGVNVFRFNVKYATPQWHQEWIGKVNSYRVHTQRFVAILIDIPGIDKAQEWLDLAAGGMVDFAALSYIRTSQNLHEFSALLKSRNSKVKVIAKIETAEAINSLEEIMADADGIMVARGDLGNELPIAEIPYYQKLIIKRSLELGKPVITATEMLQSMIANPNPTRAEVSDVANAMYDATDAVMLSGESAIGSHPLAAISLMRQVASFIDSRRPVPQYNYEIRNQTDALTMAANDLVRQKTIDSQKIAAFIVATESGDTVRSLARLRPTVPIVAVTPNLHVCYHLSLSWGVYPVLLANQHGSYDENKQNMLLSAAGLGVVRSGDHVIMVYGNEIGQSGATNVIRIESV